MIPVVAFTAGFQPEMVPSSVAKMNLAPDVELALNKKIVAVPLATIPVGVLPVVGGTVTTRLCFTPLPL